MRRLQRTHHDLSDDEAHSEPITKQGLASASSAATLVATKLHAPWPRRDLVPRLRLIERLCANWPRRLTLIDAPAGWGKSTLLIQWRQAMEKSRRFAWLSLDRSDNDPVRFWTYVVEALRSVGPNVGESSVAALRIPGADLLDVVMPILINDLEALRTPTVLILDDYHLITNRKIQESVGFLIEHLPASLHLALATRSDPPLPLARLRARGDMVEIRAEELRFNQAETTSLLNDALRLDLDPDDVGRLQERTEGWVAGLYLAALSLQGRSDVGLFIEAFAGDDRHIVDYLGAEVLDGQTDEVRAFLLKTSILERLCGPLCDAVLAAEGSARILQAIERSNLFLVPLDRKRRWYRYHHLFGELLRRELEDSERASLPSLHRRAAAWHRDEGLIPEAISHFVAAGEATEAGELVALHWNDFLNQGHLETVDAWLDTIPAALVSGDARLCLARAGTSLTLGRRDEVDAWLDAAERCPPLTGTRAGGTSVESEAAIYRAVHSYMRGDVSRATDAARHAAELESAGTSPWAAMAFAALGRSLYWRGQAPDAASALQEALQRAQPPRNNLSVIGALGYLAELRVEDGDVETAEELAQTAISMSEEQGLSEHWVTMTALVARAKSLLMRGRRSEAEVDSSRGVELARRGAGPVERAFALVALAELRHELGDRDKARGLIREARGALDNCPDPGIARDMLEKTERSLRLTPRSRRQTHDYPNEDLSDRELAVLRLLFSDLSQREIGRTLHVSHNTVKTHVRGIYRKLRASTRAEALTRARESGLL